MDGYYYTPQGTIVSHAPSPALGITSGQTYTPPKGGTSVIGWILAAAAVAMLYQVKPIRPIVAGILLLIALGLVLRFEPTVQSQMSQIFKK